MNAILAARPSIGTISAPVVVPLLLTLADVPGTSTRGAHSLGASPAAASDCRSKSGRRVAKFDARNQSLVFFRPRPLRGVQK
jgi:hypothetical protein